MRVTASKVGLLGFCRAWAREDAVWRDTSGPNAARGTRLHQAIVRYVQGDLGDAYEPEEDIAAEFGQACAWLDSLGVPLARLRVERAFAWDPETDTAEDIGSDRDYSEARGRLCGTADLVMLTTAEDKPVHVTVWDWKTGDGTGAGPQLRTLGLMAARAYGVESATVAALEVRANGVTEVAREDLDAFALASWAGELSELLASVEGAEPQPGSHCGELYCPARLTCPVGQAAIGDAVSSEAVIPAEHLVRRADWRITDPIQTPEQAMWAVDVMRLMTAWLDARKDEIKALVPEGGWRAADGRVLKETTATIKAFDKTKALALLKQLGATDAQQEACWYEFQKSNGLRISGGITKARPRRGKAA